jgi:hypothetical protein
VSIILLIELFTTDSTNKTLVENTLIPVTDCEATKVLFVLSVVNSSISNMMDTIGIPALICMMKNKGGIYHVTARSN